ncbi:hypothetical protein ACOSP7_015761 [Xanthoceras sorbifolium]
MEDQKDQEESSNTSLDITSTNMIIKTSSRHRKRGRPKKDDKLLDDSNNIKTQDKSCLHDTLDQKFTSCTDQQKEAADVNKVADTVVVMKKRRRRRKGTPRRAAV